VDRFHITHHRVCPLPHIALRREILEPSPNIYIYIYILLHTFNVSTHNPQIYPPTNDGGPIARIVVYKYPIVRVPWGPGKVPAVPIHSCSVAVWLTIHLAYSRGSLPRMHRQASNPVQPISKCYLLKPGLPVNACCMPTRPTALCEALIRSSNVISLGHYKGSISEADSN